MAARRYEKSRRTFPNIFRRLLKIAEDDEEDPRMFRCLSVVKGTKKCYQ